MNTTKKACLGIIARLGSKRLKDKHLSNTCGRPIISYLIQRIKREFYDEIIGDQLEIFILTGNESNNGKFAEIANEHGISVFFGNDSNVPLRILELLNNKSYNFFIGIDGDDILCAPEGMRKVYDSMVLGSKYVRTIDYPFGMNSMGICKNFLADALKGKEHRNLETGWGWIFDDSLCEEIGDQIKQDERLRFTLDYPEDLLFFNNIISSKLDVYASTRDIIEFVIENELFLNNMFLNELYWENFNSEKLSEMKG
jgi:spore coat polysaccharide biosynthesis protein SpsF (cytidylyltransferase family)